MCEGLSNNGMVRVSNDGDISDALNLDELWPALKQASFTEHTFWTQCPGKHEWLARYKALAAGLTDMGEFLFRQLDRFKHLPKIEPSPSALRTWAADCPKELAKWVPEEVNARMQDICFNKCSLCLRSLFSAGLTAVAQVVDMVKTPGSDAPLTQQSQEELLSKIPQGHPLRDLCGAFLQVTWLFEFLEPIRFRTKLD